MQGCSRLGVEMTSARPARRRVWSVINAACALWISLAAILAFPDAGWGGEGVIPMTLNYQGVYKEDGVPYNGVKNMAFRLTTADGSIEYWASGPKSVSVSTGAFQAVGRNHAIP